MMHAISLWQPWASLWIVTPRIKRHETRHWRPPRYLIGRRILVHAAKTRQGIRGIDEGDDELAQLCAARFGKGWRTELPMGGFIGSILLADVVETDPVRRPTIQRADFACGNWGPGRFGWLGEDPRGFPMVPALGRQAFWQVHDVPAGAIP